VPPCLRRLLHRPIDLAVCGASSRQGGRRSLPALDDRSSLRAVRSPGAADDLRIVSVGARGVRGFRRRGDGDVGEVGGVDETGALTLVSSDTLAIAA
jgi:hypothetical protein